MRRILYALLLVISVNVVSCQCSNKPDIGPVEDEARLEVRDVTLYA